MNIHEMRKAVSDAELTIRSADNHVAELLPLIRGRLNKVSDRSYTNVDNLRALKKELKSFNANTGRWKA